MRYLRGEYDCSGRYLAKWNAAPLLSLQVPRKRVQQKPERKDFLEWYITEQVLALLNMEEHKERLAEKIIAAYKSGMETNKTEEYKRQIQITETKLNNVLDLLIEKKSDSLMKNLTS